MNPLNLLFPPKCIICGEIVKDERTAFCDECIKTAEFNIKSCRICAKPLDTVYGEDICTFCRKNEFRAKQAFVPFIYKGKIRQAILRFKFYRRPSYAKAFSSVIFEKIKSSGYSPDAVTFVPIHFLRKGKRGYNQSELIAKDLAKLFGVKCIATLKKVKNTKPLSGMTKNERKESVKGAYKCLKNIPEYNKLLLIDDIITTGATVNECVKTLNKRIKSEISVAAVATVE